MPAYLSKGSARRGCIGRGMKSSRIIHEKRTFFYGVIVIIGEEYYSFNLFAS